MIINGYKVTQKHFAYDGCHKIYLLKDKRQVAKAESHGYEIHPIELLQDKWDESCGLRFISTWDLQQIVKQYERATFIHRDC